MENTELQTLAIDVCHFTKSKKLGTIPIKSERYNPYVADIVALTKLGWTFDVTDNAFAYSYASHNNHETEFFTLDEELENWLKSKCEMDGKINKQE